MKHAERIIIVHNGALGDFLMAWPTIYSLCRALPDTVIIWAGKRQYLQWLTPLGIRPATQEIMQMIRGLYAEKNPWAHGSTYRILWFCLRKNPLQIKQENIFFFKGIAKEGFQSPRIVYAAALKEQGIFFNENWMNTFQQLLPRMTPPEKKQILLFPGSGNVSKNWPLVQFFKLVPWLEERGMHPVIVLGPVEQEQGITPPQNMVTKRPQSLEELGLLLQQAAFVIGNDSGPMHLAGCMGIPGLALFGPTSPKQWGPWGIDILSENLPCSPCTQTARITCKHPVCITKLRFSRVTATLVSLLGKQKLLPKTKPGHELPITHDPALTKRGST